MALIDGYSRPSQLEHDLEELEKSIEDIKNGNYSIINSTVTHNVQKKIDSIEGNIKITKRNNFAKSCIRNIKIFGKMIQAVGPYVVAAGLLFGSFVIFGDIPFYPQEVFKTNCVQEIIDNHGNVERVDNYQSYPDESKKAFYTTKWVKKIDGRYYRTSIEYNFKDYTLEELKKMAVDPNLNYEEAFGKKVNKKTEVRNEVSEEELAEENTLRIIFPHTEEEDVILSAQDPAPNILFSLLYLALVGGIYACIIYFRRNESSFDYEDDVDDIKSEYEKVDIAALKDMFDKKKIRFERIVHNKEEKEEDYSNAYQDKKKTI